MDIDLITPWLLEQRQRAERQSLEEENQALRLIIQDILEKAKSYGRGNGAFISTTNAPPDSATVGGI